MPTFYDPTSCYTTYDPTCCCTTNATTTTSPILSGSINIAPNTITWTTNNKEQEEYIEKLEKHIDELEEDIEYFNGQLEEKEAKIEYLMAQIDDLNKNTANMDSHITYIEARLLALEDKVRNEMDRALAPATL